MKMQIATGFLSIAAIGLAGAAMAHEMDTDQDGLYTYAEMLTEYPALAEADYAALDLDGDEVVDAEELAAAWDEGRLAPMED